MVEKSEIELAKKFVKKKNALLYKKALCYKMVNRFEEATDLYNQHRKLYKHHEYLDIRTTIFGILMIPRSKNRR